MRKIKALSIVMCVLLTVSLLASCAASSMADKDMVANDAYYKESLKGSASGDVMESPSLDGSLGVGTNGSVSDSASTGEYERKIIKTVNMTAETKEYDKAIASIADIIAAHGGYVESSSTNGKSYNNYGTYRRHAAYTIRIPAENLDAFLGGLGQFLNVTNNDASQNDVSGKYYDIVSRLETLEAERTALMAMYEKAETIDYMLQVQQRLYDVIEEIEAYTTSLKYYDGQVSYSTVHLNVNEVIEYTDVTDPITYGERVTEAFKDSWKDFAEGCQDFSIWFVGAIPTLLVIAVIGCGVAGIVVLILRSDRKKRLEKKANDQTKAE